MKAQCTVGNVQKVKLINLAQLKAKDPNEQPAVQPASSPENLEQSSSSPAGAENPAQVVPGTGATDSASNASSARVPVTTANSREWFEGDTDLPSNGPFTRRGWKLTCQYTGTEFTAGCDTNCELKSIDYFMALFPKKQLSSMVERTSSNLVGKGHSGVAKGELLKWIGVTILITRFKFGDKRSLWSTKHNCKCIPPANIGEKTGMARERYEAIASCMVWSVQPPTRPAGMSSEAYRWLLIEDFVENINDHRATCFSPSWLVCADESISRWCGLGGHWINMGLPMCVSMDRKPEDGLEIQNACCAKSNIMMRLKLVKTAAANAEEDGDGEFLHGCNVLAELVRPWANTDRVVVADSYYASVQAALRLKAMGLRFIGTVKTATRGFPMHYLQRVVLPGGKGDHRALLITDTESGTTLLACVWADRDRRYFIATCSSTTPCRTIVRRRWRQRDVTPNAPPVVENVNINQPEAGEIYYAGCGKIDEHNRVRQEYLDLEKKLRTMKWDTRANHTLLGMIIVDSYRLRQGCQGPIYGGARAFIEELAVDLIDNDYDRRSLRRRREQAMEQEANLVGGAMPVLDTAKHLTAPTPTKKRKPNNVNHRQQGRCMICKKPCSHVCRACQLHKPSDKDKQHWICNKAGKTCMGKHIMAVHPNLIGD